MTQLEDLTKEKVPMATFSYTPEYTITICQRDNKYLF